MDTFIFIPAYNVENELPSLLSRIPEEVWNRAWVCLINDGSKDNTLNKALEFTKKTVPQYDVFSFTKNQGYGSVVKKGFSLALETKAKYICCLHGDGQYPPEKLPAFLTAMEKNSIDVLQGSRHVEKGGAERGGMPLYKRWGGAFLTSLENLFFKSKLTDRHSGFLCYSRRFLEEVPWSQLGGSFDIDLELIAFADARNYKIEEHAIETRYAGEKSNLNVIPYGMRVLRIIYRKRRGFYSPN